MKIDWSAHPSKKDIVAFRDALAEDVKAAAKGSGWKHKQGVLFRQVDTWFFETSLSLIIEGAPPHAKAVLRAKPMALDPLLWKLMFMEENNSEPLSLRAWGAFVCSSVILSETELEATDSADTARAYLSYLQTSLPDALETLAATPFSEIVLAQAKKRRGGRGDETLLLSLVLEEQEAATRDLAIYQLEQGHHSLATYRHVPNPEDPTNPLPGKDSKYVAQLYLDHLDGLYDATTPPTDIAEGNPSMTFKSKLLTKLFGIKPHAGKDDA